MLENVEIIVFLAPTLDINASGVDSTLNTVITINTNMYTVIARSCDVLFPRGPFAHLPATGIESSDVAISSVWSCKDFLVASVCTPANMNPLILHPAEHKNVYMGDQR